MSINTNVIVESAAINWITKLMLVLGFRLEDVCLADISTPAEIEEVGDYLLANEPDRFYWLEDVRGLSEDLLRQEDRIEEETNFLIKKGESARKWWERISSMEKVEYEVAKREVDVMVDNKGERRWLEMVVEDYKELTSEDFFDQKEYEKYRKWISSMSHRARALEKDIEAVDSSFIDIEEIDDTMPSYGKRMESYLEMYIDKMDVSTLAVVADVLDQEFKERDDFSWYYFLRCGMAVYGRLWKFTGHNSWALEFKRLKKNWDTNHKMSQFLCPSNEDRFYGAMSFDMESAIDQMREIRKLAEVNGQSELLVYQQMVDAQNTTIENFQGDWNDLMDDTEYDAQYDMLD